MARRSPLSLVLGITLVTGAFAYLMAFPPILNHADESFVLYESKRFWQGDAPYRDFFDFITPGTFYFYAAAYALVGPNITAARGATALLNAASCGLTYILARHLASPAVSAVAAAAFITVMVPAWNHAGHHWLATFLSLATAVVTLSRRWQDSGRGRPALAGALGAALLCSHQGRGTWVVLWLVITLPVLAWTRPGPDRGWRRAMRESAWAFLAALAVGIPMMGWAVWRSSLREVVDATYTFVVQGYTQRNVGMVKWGQALETLVGMPDPRSWPWFLRAIPALLAIEGMSLFGPILADGVRPHIVRASLFLLAVCSAYSILYFPDFIHIATIAPFPLVVVAGLVQRAGTALAAFGDSRLTAAWRLGGALVAVAVVATGVRELREARTSAPMRVPTAFGTIALDEGAANILRDVRAAINPDGKQTPKLFAYPSDAWLYLTLPADNPTPFSLMMAKYNTPAQFDQAIAELRRNPDSFALVRWPLLAPHDPIYTVLRREREMIQNVGDPVPGTKVHGLLLYGPRGRPADPPTEEKSGK